MNPSSSAHGAQPSYLLIFRDGGTETYKSLSAEQRQQLFARWYEWYDGLVAAGKLKDGHPLESGGSVVSAAGGRIVDGPFTEGKEVVGGYFLLTVGSLEEAVAIAKRCPTLALGLDLTVEVRTVAAVCPVLDPERPGSASEASAGDAGVV